METHKHTILVVEDGVYDAALIQLAFQKAGFDDRIEVATNPAAALQYLSGEGPYTDRSKFPFPDLVILDHNLPGDGWTIIQWIRRHPDLDSLPITVFSGSADPAHQRKAFDLGANAYFFKPVPFDQFIQTIRKIRDFHPISRPPRNPDS